ncbi:flippase [Chloroflexota bacterium]
MQKPLDDSLDKIARGAGIAVVGMMLGVLFVFVTRLIIARYGLQSSYGTFSLAVVILQVAMLLSGLGLHRGATRYIAHFRGGDDKASIRATMFSSLRFSIFASIIVGLVVYFSADYVSINFFNAPDLAPAMKIFAFGVPFTNLTRMLISFFQGYDRVAPGVFFQNIVLNAITLIILIIIVTAGFSFNTVFYAYLIAIVVTSIIIAVYTTKRLPERITLTDIRRSPPVTRELLMFSLPLLGSSIVTMLMINVDTLMLGYYKTMDMVGLYNAAHPLATFISIPLTALILIYTPVATGLFSRNKMTELRRNYIVLTKWLVSLTLPVFLVVALFPEATVRLFFGQEYIGAAAALRILSIGFIFNNLLGPNAETLIAKGHPRFILWATVSTAAMNIVLNMLLIPPMGMEGAAIGSAISLTSINAVRSLWLYRLSGIQPFSKNLLKPLAISVVLALLIQLISSTFLTVTFWMIPIIFVIFCVIYLLAVLFSRSFDKEDIALLQLIEKRSGINTTPLKKLLGRFR